MNTNKSIRFTEYQTKLLDKESKRQGIKFSALVKQIIDTHLRGDNNAKYQRS